MHEGEKVICSDCGNDILKKEIRVIIPPKSVLCEKCHDKMKEERKHIKEEKNESSFFGFPDGIFDSMFG